MSDDAGKEARENQTAGDRLERARQAAKKFAKHFSFPAQYLEQINGDPIQQPLTIERDGVSVEVFRWLGHGRGAPIVQVELCNESDATTVYGGFGDREFGPWKHD